MTLIWYLGKMLILTRQTNDTFYINKQLQIKITNVNGSGVMFEFMDDYEIFPRPTLYRQVNSSLVIDGGLLNIKVLSVDGHKIVKLGFTGDYDVLRGELYKEDTGD